MKITHLEAENVHGYLPVNVDFFSDLTFLTGVNGSGKTTALRLLMALLTPSMMEFAKISFTKAVVNISYDDSDVEIRAIKTPESLELSVSGVQEKLFLTSSDLELFTQERAREESRSPVHEKVLGHEVYKAIKMMTNPMFLGLDRRFSIPVSRWEEDEEARRREFHYRRAWHDSQSGKTATAGLRDVNFLLSDKMMEISSKQERLDESLRGKLLASAFEYSPVDFATGRSPSREELDQYRQRIAHIERAAEGLRLPIPELKATLTTFLERLTNVVDEQEKTAKMSKKEREKHAKDGGSKVFVEWFFNRAHADKILGHISLLDTYGSDRTALHEPIERFLSLTNSFLSQTNKRVSVTPKGELNVVMNGSMDDYEISALSSGELQLVVMLAHLSLNNNLSGSGVFIVDEPELSLHLDWQEKFVDAIREANPSVQLIMATHSPAIILDRLDSCVSINSKNNGETNA
jgi:DNA repair exonuclease SbcCD ATPase subunit